MKFLIILNRKPGPDEYAYNALRIALQLQKDDNPHQLFIYLIADGAYCAVMDEIESKGPLNVSAMLGEVIGQGAEVKMCTSCGDARGLKDQPQVKGVEWTNLKTLTDWIIQCDKVINY